MKLYNTETREKENFKPVRTDNVKVYYCGPTVYNYAHIGNLKTYIFNDVVVKTLKFVGGYNVKTTMNITDIDDKTIRDSMASGEKLKDFTEKYTEIFLSDIEKLGVEKADVVEPISNVIPEMVEIINDLLKKGYAYASNDGSIYFKISEYKDYGKFAHLDMENMISSVRIDNDEYEKETAGDFALWKGYSEEDGENYWEETFVVDGEEKVFKGRPGWHIECSACNKKHFNNQVDIHMGGIDLVFPHHQNEIAQSEAHSGKKFAKYWVHSGHLTVDGKKMSKSANNFYKLKDLEEKYSDVEETTLYRAIRLGFVNSRYRDSVDFSFAKLESNFNAIKGIDETSKRLKHAIDMAESHLDVTIQKGGFLKVKGIRRDFRDSQQSFIADFLEVLEDDFNTTEALSIFFEYQTFVNRMIDAGENSLEELVSMKDMIDSLNYVLGIAKMEIFEESDEIPAELNELLEKRQEARANKDYALADSLRDEISEKGYKIIDTSEGARLERV